MLEGGDVLTDSRLKVLTLSKADILSPRITEDVTEEFYATTTFLLEVDRICRPVHLSLGAGRSFKADCRYSRLGTVRFDIGTHSRITADVAQLAKLFEGSLGSELWVAVEQLMELIQEGIELTFSSDADWTDTSRRRR